MSQIHTIGVYCASSNQLRQEFNLAAYNLGRIIAREGIRLVYGDGGIGLMKQVADGALSEGGEVIGIIPQFMVDEGWNNPLSTQTIVVGSMHQRKAKIVQMVDAMVALPGGIGTMEELAECLTWKQLGLHTKPVVMLNTEHFFDPLLYYFDRMVEEHFIRPIHREQMFTVVSEPQEVLPALINAPHWDTKIRREAAI